MAPSTTYRNATAIIQTKNSATLSSRETFSALHGSTGAPAWSPAPTAGAAGPDPMRVVRAEDAWAGVSATARARGADCCGGLGIGPERSGSSLRVRLDADDVGAFVAGTSEDRSGAADPVTYWRGRPGRIPHPPARRSAVAVVLPSPRFRAAFCHGGASGEPRRSPGDRCPVRSVNSPHLLTCGPLGRGRITIPSRRRRVVLLGVAGNGYQCVALAQVHQRTPLVWRPAFPDLPLPGADHAAAGGDRVQLTVVVDDQRADQTATRGSYWMVRMPLPPRPWAVYSSMAVRLSSPATSPPADMCPREPH